MKFTLFTITLCLSVAVQSLEEITTVPTSALNGWLTTVQTGGLVNICSQSNICTGSCICLRGADSFDRDTETPNSIQRRVSTAGYTGIVIEYRLGWRNLDLNTNDVFTLSVICDGQEFVVEDYDSTTDDLSPRPITETVGQARCDNTEEFDIKFTFGGTNTNERVAINNLVIKGERIEDFRFGIQFSDGNPGQDLGASQFTPFASVGGYSRWAGNLDFDTSYHVRLFLEKGAGGLGTTLAANTDIRLCIQMSDLASDSAGNPEFAGSERCTPWASSANGGGWSGWASDINTQNPDSARIRIHTRPRTNFRITNIQAGVQLTDNNIDPATNGPQRFTPWLTAGSGPNSVQTVWTSDNNGHNPDAIRIFLRVQTSAAFEFAEDETKGNKTEGNNDIFWIIVAGAIAISGLLLAGAFVCWRKKRTKNGKQLEELPADEEIEEKATKEDGEEVETVELSITIDE